MSPKYSHLTLVSGCTILRLSIDHNMDVQNQIKNKLDSNLVNVTLFYIRFNEMANVRTDLARFYYQEFDGLLLLPRRRGCFVNLFFSSTFVIKNKQIQENFRLRLKGVTFTKNLASQQPSKIENMINDLIKERKRVRLLLQ